MCRDRLLLVGLGALLTSTTEASRRGCRLECLALAGYLPGSCWEQVVRLLTKLHRDAEVLEVLSVCYSSQQKGPHMGQRFLTGEVMFWCLVH